MPGRGSTSNARPERRTIILEMTRVGASQKVTAVDDATGIEVSFVAPASAARSDIERLARRKLAYVLRKQESPQ